MRRARPYRGENHGPGKDVQGELDLTPGIRERPELENSQVIRDRVEPTTSRAPAKAEVGAEH
jgi:hypothetical protein